MLDKLPDELKIYNQFVLWRYEDRESSKPTKVPYSPKDGRLASVTDSSTWTSFEDARYALSLGGYDGLGFVLTPLDPYTFIDLDNTNGDEVALDRQLKIYQEFDSYAERSPSGTGLHIIIKGEVPSGRKRSFVELYSSRRYMTVTGDVYRNGGIKEYHNLVNALWQQMSKGNEVTNIYCGLAEQKDTDEVVINRATDAKNGVKFNNLLNGNWQEHYPSQSEADFAFIDILAFYTQNRKQIERIFKGSGLGQRDKSKRQDYINWMINKSFDRMLPPVNIEGLQEQIEKVIEAKAKKKVKPIIESPIKKEIIQNDKVFTVPPGLVGDLARFIYDQAPRPVAEIALVGAIGLVAGIIGRAYNISGTGLNQYILLLAPTGVGKEAIASGVDKLMADVVRTVPASIEFVGPAEIASAQAMTKYMSKTAVSFVSVVGEFGIYLQQMANINAPPHLAGLRRMLLDLYNKSGEGKVVRPSIWSDKDKNTTCILAPAFTLLGESTPEKFYEGLHEGMISEGLLPRFTILEYRGDRPKLNKNHTFVKPSFELIEKLSTLCTHALNLNSQNKAIHVQLDHEAKQLFDDYDVQCDGYINNSEREVKRQLWNRAHIKALKLAALVSVGINPYNPTIDFATGQWAIGVINADVKNILSRFDAGEIGEGQDEMKQIKLLIKTCKKFVLSSWDEVQGYKAGTYDLHAQRFIPYAYLHKRLTLKREFKQDKRGGAEALKRAIQTLIDRGDIEQVSKVVLARDYSASGNYYMINNMKILEGLE